MQGDLGDLLDGLELETEGRDPTELLVEALTHARAMAEAYRLLVGGLWHDPADAPPDAPTMVTEGYLGDATHSAITEFGAWLDRVAKLSKLATDAGIDERRQQLAEDEAEVLAAVMRGTAVELIGIVRRHFAAAGLDTRPVDVELTASLPSIMRRQIEAGHRSTS